MRLVSKQDWHKATEQFTEYFTSLAPEGAKVEVKPHHGGQPYVTPTDSAEYKAASAAFEESFGKVPVPMYEGGSIPIIAEFKDVLGIESILMGFGFDTDGLHSPNEHFGVWNFNKGIDTVPRFFAKYAEMKTQA
jgi:acetylornithine deacetylase/succinyl-diaminopimelate desuccinylase-like protein